MAVLRTDHDQVIDPTGAIISDVTVERDVTEETNHAGILAKLAEDLASMQAIIDTANPSFTTIAQAQAAARDAARERKDIARALRRLIRLAVNQLDDTD